jgi:hypothetical protein
MSSIIKVDTVQDIDGNNIINENANTITIGASGDTITIPSGATLANNGTATGFASIAWQSSIVTAATLTAVAGEGYWINTTSNACTVTLPASASVGDQLIFTDYARTWGTNAVTINPNSLNFQGNTTPQPVYDTNGESIDIVYSGATQGWIPNTDGAVALETPQFYDIDFLVVAGGAAGGAGSSQGGGGGAGGFRTSTQTEINLGTVITVTVGDGGAAVIGTNVIGTSGSNSSISGSGLTTITSAGGGGGGVNGYDGANGGSGGGGGAADTPSTFGSGNTPSTSPSQGNNGGTGYDGTALVTIAAGGGGAGAVGGNSGTATTGAGAFGGPGGNGSSSSITGSSVTYAGGGGGATERTDASSGAGGTGGGGAAANRNPNTSAVAGTVNLGGGGGGGCNSIDSGLSGAGGKGVVILSMLDAKYSGTTTGSPTVATGVSGKTVLTFTGSGSYTT